MRTSLSESAKLEKNLQCTYSLQSVLLMAAFLTLFVPLYTISASSRLIATDHNRIIWKMVVQRPLETIVQRPTPFPLPIPDQISPKVHSVRIPSLPESHLTYCLNVHPGASPEETRRAVFQSAPDVFQHLEAKTPIASPRGIGLWLPDAVSREWNNNDALLQWKDQLDEAGLYVPTMNGFPYGTFHGRRIKQDVYRPDWSDSARIEYTIRLAEILARLLPEGIDGTISTLPVTYREWGDPDRIGAAADGLIQVVRHLRRLEVETGRVVRLAIEPEPDCWIDDVESVVRFWAFMRERLSSADADADAWERYAGLCLDTAHVAALFEDPLEVLDVLRRESIPIHKMQISAVPEVPVGADPKTTLALFQDEIYLHQTCLLESTGEKTRYPDLDVALADHDSSSDTVWRTHFHVPLTWRPEPPLRTTTDLISPRFLRQAYEDGVRHFELEVYCLGLMLPNEDAVHDMLASDLAELMRRFEAI